MAVKGTKVEKINLNKLLKKSVHLPRTQSGYTLYTHADTFDESRSDGDSFDRQALNDEFYTKLCKTNYNSPTNIKRLFVTGDKVYIQYYTSMFKGGKQDQGTWMTRSLKTDSGKDLFEIAKDIVEFKQKEQGYVMEKAMNPSAQPPVLYTFDIGEQSNNLIKALSCGWVLSNIEEFYFDWTALLPSEVFTTLGGKFQSSADIAKTFMNGTENKIVNAAFIGELVRKFNCGGVKNLESRFPRLRIVGMIPNLSAVMENENMDKATGYGATTYEEIAKSWLKTNEALIKSIGGLTMIYSFGNDSLLFNYKTKESQYLFDSTLKSWFETHTEKLKTLRRRGMYSEGNSNESESLDGDSASEPIVNRVEKELLRIEKELKPDEFKLVLSITVSGFGINDLRNLFNSFTVKNRNRYASMINLRL